MKRKQGLFITFEGSEGCGKSTQIRLLGTRLKRLGYSVLVLREPGGTPIGESIRHLLQFSKSNARMTHQTELLLFSASRAQLVREKILPALARGDIVLCDRFVDSTTVYQGLGRKLDRTFIARLNTFATGGRVPDLTLVLDMDTRTGLARAQSRTRKRDRMEQQRRSFYETVRRGFRSLARMEPRRIKVIDASGNIEDVCDSISRQVSPLLKKRL